MKFNQELARKRKEEDQRRKKEAESEYIATEPVRKAKAKAVTLNENGEAVYNAAHYEQRIHPVRQWQTLEDLALKSGEGNPRFQFVL